MGVIGLTYKGIRKGTGIGTGKNKKGGGLNE